MTFVRGHLFFPRAARRGGRGLPRPRVVRLGHRAPRATSARAPGELLGRHADGLATGVRCARTRSRSSTSTARSSTGRSRRPPSCPSTSPSTAATGRRGRAHASADGGRGRLRGGRAAVHPLPLLDPRRHRAGRALRDVRHRRPGRRASPTPSRTAPRAAQRPRRGHLGDDLQAALEATELLEWACGVYVHACAIGTPRTSRRGGPGRGSCRRARDVRLRRPPRHVGVGTCLASRPRIRGSTPSSSWIRGAAWPCPVWSASVACEAPRRGAHMETYRQTGHTVARVRGRIRGGRTWRALVAGRC